MGKIIQRYKRTITIRKMGTIVPKGYHKCPNCGGDGICKTQTKKARKNS